VIRFDAQAVTLDAAAGEDQPRTISGIAVPYGVDATVSTGQRVRIEAGALPTDGPAPRLLAEHDTSQVVGIVTAREDTPDGMLFTAEIARTRAGDDLVALLKMGAYDSVSVGIEPTQVTQDGPTTIVKAAKWSELSVVYEPAFAAAKITQIAAAQGDMPDNPNTTPETETPEMTEQTPEPVQAAAPDIIPVQTVPAVPRKFSLPSAAEWIAAALEGGHRWHLMNDQIKAAAPDVTTTSNDGVLPEPIVGPVYNQLIGNRPFIDAFGTKAMPGSGKVFIRPSVDVHTSMAVQASENGALQSGEFQIKENQVTKSSYGGYVRVSEQIRDWSDPDIISLLLDDMARVYGDTTDNVAADAFVTAATQTLAFPGASTDATNWLTWLYDAAEDILTNSTGHLPTHLFLGTGNWKNLGKLEDDQGRPLFPQVGPMNALGTTTPGTANFTAFGLQVVVDRNFDSGVAILGDTIGFEIFEQTKGFLSVDNGSTRSRDISWLGYLSTLMLDVDRYVKAV
jgi:hypothetical protein